MRDELDALKEEMDRRLARLEKEQATTDRFLRGGNGSRGLSTRVVALETELTHLKKWKDKTTARAFMLILATIGAVIAAVKKMVGASP